MKRLKKTAALSYKSGDNETPRVIASGRGEIAERIISLARENDIPVHQNEWAADILSSMPLDSEIPDVLYQAIAEIYAVILRAEKENRGRIVKKE